MNRAYSTLEIKATADAGGKRSFTGIASTPSTDRMGDVVEPKGAQFKLPIPLLWQHDSKQPIGWVTAAKVTGNGIEVTGEIASIEEDGPLKQRLTDAWQMLKAKLVRGLSIGFNSIESARIDGTYGMKFIKWEWLELSAVTIPANQDASILAIKSIDEKSLAALGRKGDSDRDSPGASGHKQQPASGGFSFSRSPKGTVMKTLAELREARATKNARMKELAELFQTDGHETTDEEGAEFDALSVECKALATDIRVAEFHASNSSGAKAVDSDTHSGRRGPTILVKKEDPEDKFQGQSMVRMAIAKALAHVNKNGVKPSDIAQIRWGKTNPKLVQWIKANEVAGGGTDSGEWGAELVAMDGRYTGDFLTFLKAATVFDSLPLRSVPANVTIKGQDGTATGFWTGQSKAIKVTTVDFSTINLTPLKVGAIAVMSKELMMDSSPEAEGLVADALRDASAQRIDATFLSTTAASAGVSPAGLLNGLSAGTSAGTDADGIRADILALYAPFIAAKNATGLVLVTTPSLAKSISLMVNALGQTEFTGLTAMGGMLLGDKVYTGDNVGAGDVILMKPSDIWKIGDSGVDVSSSDVAMIEQSSAPTGATDTPVAATATFTSMFQEDSVAIKVVRRINYAKRRTGVVGYIGDAAYAPGAGS